jgi:hypothetical protein
MPLGPEQEIYYTLGGSLDEKTDGVHVQPANLLQARNGHYDQPGAFTKRKGYARMAAFGGGDAHEGDKEEVVGGAQDITAFRACQGSRVAGDNRLLAVGKIESDAGLDYTDGWRTLGRLESDRTWKECGSHNPVGFRLADLSRSVNAHSCDHAIAGNYIMAAYVYVDTPVSVAADYHLIVEVLDKATLTLVARQDYTGYYNVRLVAHPLGTGIAILSDQVLTNRIDIAWWAAATPITMPSFDTTFITDALGNTFGRFDATACFLTPTYFVAIAYRDTASDAKVAIAGWGSSAPSATDSKAETGAGAFGIYSSGDAVFHVSYADGGGDYDIHYLKYTISAGPALTRNLDETAAAITSNLVANSAIGPDATDSDVMRIYWTEYVLANTYPYKVATVSRSGGSWGSLLYMSGSSTAQPTRRTGAMIYSKPFSYGDHTYIYVMFHSDTQPTLFLMGLRTVDSVLYWEVVGRVLDARCGPLSDVVGGHTPQVITTATGVWNAIAFRQEFVTGGYSYTWGSSIAVIADFTNRCLTELAGSQTVMSGGMTRSWDGSRSNPIGIPIYPEGFTLAESNTAAGALTLTGTYNYKLTYEYTDRAGNRYRSAPSAAVAKTLTGANDTITLSVPALGFMDVEAGLDTVVRVYRTTDGGTTYYDTGVVIDNVLTGTAAITGVDTISDANLATNPLLYTTGGELENSPAPTACAIATVGKRLFLVPSDDRNSIWYSKEKVDTLGWDFSASLVVRLEDEGDIAALAALDDRLVIFKRDGIYLLEGIGPNALGQGAFRTPIKISSDSGAISQRGVVATAAGVMYASDKGIFQLDRGLRTTYIGAPVEDSANYDIYSAVYHTSENKAFFATSNAEILMYDTLVRKWSVWDSPLSPIDDMAVWNGLHVQCGTHEASDLTAIMVYDTSIDTDEDRDFSLFIETGWLQPFGFQGWGRIKEFIFQATAGDPASTYLLTFNVSYDYRPATTQYRVSDYTDSDDIFNVRFTPSRQKCSAVKFTFSDSSIFGVTEPISIKGWGVVVQRKTGPYKWNNYDIT